DRGRPVEEHYFDLDNAPVENSNGHHRITRSYDQNPTRVTTRYFAADGTPACLGGFCIEEASYDDFDNLVSRDFRGEAGQPSSHMQGFVREERSYDAFSRQTGQRYFSIDNEPVMTALGYAGWDAEYDEHGNRTRMAFLDKGGNPVAGRPIEIM